MQILTDYRPDGTFRTRVSFPSQRELDSIELTGHWRVDDDQLHIEIRYASEPDVVLGSAGADTIREITEDRLVTVDDEGTVTSFRRVHRSWPLTITLICGMALLLIGSIGIIVTAFRTHVGWGLACLVVSIIQWVFVATHWPRAKRWFITQILGLALMGTSGVVLDAMELHPYVFPVRASSESGA
jgi:hypothetical protein